MCSVSQILARAVGKYTLQEGSRAYLYGIASSVLASGEPPGAEIRGQLVFND